MITYEEMYPIAISTIAKTFDKDMSCTKPTTHLKDELGLDSLDKVDLLMTLEEELGVELYEDDDSKLNFNNIATIKDIVKFMSNSINGDIFKYTRPPLPDGCICLVSGSNVSKFFEYPVPWYNEVILGKESEFKGNTATVTGTVGHHLFKCVGKDEEVKREVVDEQIRAYVEHNPDLNLDLNQIMSDYPPTAIEVINKFILPAKSKGGLFEVEKQVTAEIMGGVYVGGTYDLLDGDCITDYKIVGRKPDEFAIPFKYKMQLGAYAYALRKKGYEVNRMRVVYGVKPTKTLAARVMVVTEMINYKEVEDALQLIAESVISVKENPKLRHLIFKSMALKEGIYDGS